MQVFSGKRRNGSNKGFTLIEAMISLSVFSLLAAGMVSGLRTMVMGASQQVVDTGMGFDARTGVDEMLTQIRSASSVIPSYTVGGKTYTTGTSRIVMTANGYDTATTGVVLPGITDYIVLDYDATRKEVRETVIPGNGSKRPARNQYLLARNVNNVSLVYRTRDRFTSNAIGLHTYGLSVSAAIKPDVSVDGNITAVVWTGLLPNQILVVAVSLGQNVEAWYPVNPSSSSALAAVKQVDVDVDFATNDDQGIARSQSMSGSACLRNQRK